MLVIVALLAADIGMIMLADSTCERAARDAARAAAAGSDATEAQNMAQACLISHRLNNSFITDPTLDLASFKYDDYGGNPPPDQSPYVEVTTSVSVKLPAPILFGQASLNMNSNGGRMALRKRYHFPIIKTKLYLGG